MFISACQDLCGPFEPLDSSVGHYALHSLVVVFPCLCPTFTFKKQSTMVNLLADRECNMKHTLCKGPYIFSFSTAGHFMFLWLFQRFCIFVCLFKFLFKSPYVEREFNGKHTLCAGLYESRLCSISYLTADHFMFF